MEMETLNRSRRDDGTHRWRSLDKSLCPQVHLYFQVRTAISILLPFAKSSQQMSLSASDEESHTNAYEHSISSIIAPCE